MLKVNLEEQARKLTKPFLMVSLAMVDYYLVSLYSCHGAMAWHRHLDEDELFMGYSGTATIETTWGGVALSFAELVTVPKGLTHRSLSLAPAMLLLVQTRGLVSRRNGFQPSYRPKGGKLQKVSVAQEAARLNDIFTPRRIARSDSLAVSVQICLGTQQWHAHQGDQLIFCQYGQLLVESESQFAPLNRGEFAVVAARERHRIVAREPATALVMAQADN